MKNLNSILIALLFIAVAILYYLHFNTTGPKSVDSVSAKVKSTSVVYVNIDSLLTKMEMYTDIQTQLAKKQMDLESNFAVRYKSFEKNISDVQKRFSDPLAIITPIQKEQIDKQLNQQKLDLENLQNNYMTQLQQEGSLANKRIVEYIVDYLNEYTKGKDIQYVLSYGFGGNILYTDKELDLTNEVLSGLNEKYLKEKSSLK